jgi:hypothetical protein
MNRDHQPSLGTGLVIQFLLGVARSLLELGDARPQRPHDGRQPAAEEQQHDHQENREFHPTDVEGHDNLAGKPGSESVADGISSEPAAAPGIMSPRGQQCTAAEFAGHQRNSVS